MFTKGKLRTREGLFAIQIKDNCLNRNSFKICFCEKKGKDQKFIFVQRFLYPF